MHYTQRTEVMTRCRNTVLVEGPRRRDATVGTAKFPGHGSRERDSARARTALQLRCSSSLQRTLARFWRGIAVPSIVRSLIPISTVVSTVVCRTKGAKGAVRLNMMGTGRGASVRRSCPHSLTLSFSLEWHLQYLRLHIGGWKVKRQSFLNKLFTMHDNGCAFAYNRG